MINTKKYIVLTMVAVLVFFTGCKDKNTQVSLTDKAENNSQTTRVEAGENSEEPSESLEEIYVYVSGQVNNPGVYCLKSNDRVFMAIEKAGGLTKKAQKQGVNMAEVLKDGQNIVVLSQKEYYDKLKENQNGSEENLDGNSDSGNDSQNSSQGTNDKTHDNEDIKENLVNINTADVEGLTSLSGIGETRAKAIIAYREENGDFKTKEDIKNVSGIGDSIYSNIEKMITVD